MRWLENAEDIVSGMEACSRMCLWNCNELQVEMGQTNRRTEGVQYIMRLRRPHKNSHLSLSVATIIPLIIKSRYLRRLSTPAYSLISTRSSALQHVRFCINILRRRVHYTNPLVYTARCQAGLASTTSYCGV